MVFDEKGMWFLIHNEDRKSLRQLAKIFDCTWKEVYAFYDDITRSDAYKKYILERTQSVKNGWLEKLGGGRDAYYKKIADAKKSQENVESANEELNSTLIDTSSSNSMPYNFV